jgi:hypothetical protein
MMHMTRGWTGFRAAVLALGLLAWSAPHAAADAMSQGNNSAGAISKDNILQYSTAGAVANSGYTGSNVISFVPVKDATVDTSSNISLGYFQVAGLSPGQMTTYNSTPFTLTVVPTGFNSAAVNDTPITISGHLSGTVKGPFQSSVQASFDPISNAGFNVPGGSGTLDLLPNSTQLLVPSSVNNGQTTLQAHVTLSGTPAPTPAPEPSTIALFLSTVGGLGLRRFVQSRRQRAAA